MDFTCDRDGSLAAQIEDNAFAAAAAQFKMDMWMNILVNHVGLFFEGIYQIMVVEKYSNGTFI